MQCCTSTSRSHCIHVDCCNPAWIGYSDWLIVSLIFYITILLVAFRSMSQYLWTGLYIHTYIPIWFVVARVYHVPTRLAARGSRTVNDVNGKRFVFPLVLPLLFSAFYFFPPVCSFFRSRTACLYSRLMYSSCRRICTSKWNRWSSRPRPPSSAPFTVRFFLTLVEHRTRNVHRGVVLIEIWNELVERGRDTGIDTGL